MSFFQVEGQHFDKNPGEDYKGREVTVCCRDLWVLQLHGNAEADDFPKALRGFKGSSSSKP